MAWPPSRGDRGDDHGRGSGLPRRSRAADGMDGARRGRRRRIAASPGNEARYYNTPSLRQIGVQTHLLVELN